MSKRVLVATFIGGMLCVAFARPLALGAPPLIWRDTGDPAALDLTDGAGGAANAPDPAGTFTFVSEDAGATNPKFEAIDARGVTWKIKLGEEAQPEVAATRLLWAAGYFTDQDYYVAELTVAGLPALQRGGQLVSEGGVIHGARLERKRPGFKKLGNWDWFDNPFLGRRELNGLRIMMSLLNNWDLKTVNNAIYEANGERRYVVSDLGATFGNTGNTLTRSKSQPKVYAATTFIDRTTPEFIDFTMHNRPFFLWAIAPSYYRARVHMEEIARHMPRTDAEWLGHRLAALSDEQVRDCFRAAGYSPDDVETLTAAVRTRIAALAAL
jgi:hypothetical protein